MRSKGLEIQNRIPMIPVGMLWDGVFIWPKAHTVIYKPRYIKTIKNNFNKLENDYSN